MDDEIDLMEQARRGLQMSVPDVWWRLDRRMSTELEVEAILYQALVPTETDWNYLAVALNV